MGGVEADTDAVAAVGEMLGQERDRLVRRLDEAVGLRLEGQADIAAGTVGKPVKVVRDF